MAIHEDDAARMQKELDALIIKYLERVPLNLDEYELHASEMRNAKKPDPTKGPQKTSIWANVDRATRAALLRASYELLTKFKPSNPSLPVVLFSVAVDRRFHSTWNDLERERWAYEVLLGKFDDMLKTLRRRQLANRGLVIHDRRVVAEQDIQNWTAAWRATAERISQLQNLADVPLFADSRATRLLQVADIVSFAVFRFYNPLTQDASSFNTIWPMFHGEGGITHGCVHFTPSYGQGSCDCAPCEQRLKADAVKRGTQKKPRRRLRNGVPSMKPGSS